MSRISINEVLELSAAAFGVSASSIKRLAPLSRKRSDVGVESRDSTIRARDCFLILAGEHTPLTITEVWDALGYLTCYNKKWQRERIDRQLVCAKKHIDTDPQLRAALVMVAASIDSTHELRADLEDALKCHLASIRVRRAPHGGPTQGSQSTRVYFHGVRRQSHSLAKKKQLSRCFSLHVETLSLTTK